MRLQQNTLSSAPPPMCTIDRSIKRGGAGKHSALRRYGAAQAHACSFVVSDDPSSQTCQGQRVVSDKRQSAFLPQRTAHTTASWPGHSVECAAPGRFVLSARNPHHAVAEWVESGLTAGLRTVQHNRRLGDLLPLTSMTTWCVLIGSRFQKGGGGGEGMSCSVA